MLSETSSVTRMPVAYISSSIAASRVASGVLAFRRLVQQLVDLVDAHRLRHRLGARGLEAAAVGFAVMSPWSTRKAQNDFTAATFRATVALAYWRSFSARM